jgi:hypothetical protein
MEVSKKMDSDKDVISEIIPSASDTLNALLAFRLSNSDSAYRYAQE